jgi:hypothetical protein
MVGGGLEGWGWKSLRRGRWPKQCIHMYVNVKMIKQESKINQHPKSKLNLQLMILQNLNEYLKTLKKISEES